MYKWWLAQAELLTIAYTVNNLLKYGLRIPRPLGIEINVKAHSSLKRGLLLKAQVLTLFPLPLLNDKNNEFKLQTGLHHR